ncbi:hypothetical protein IJG04_03060 [Candidatus Saccharibacteria bacterium]|nr:hypothetical protein [Candidatus Saccharibacteria bacterium]
MEPNQNMNTQNPVQPVAGAGETGTSVANGATPEMAGPTPEQMMDSALQEQESTMGANAEVKPEKPKKKSSAVWLVIALMAVLMLGGIGFGVWEMIASNQQIEGLNKQITALRQDNSELQAQIDEMPVAEDGDTIINIDTDTVVNSVDYIYLGEFGIKIQKPENWQSMISGYGYYNDGSSNGMGAYMIEESSETDLANVGITAGCNGEAVCVTVNGNSYSVTAGEGASEVFVTYFTNQENYSAI